MDSSNTKPDVPVTMDSFSTLDQGWETDSTYSADGQLKALGYAPELKRVHTFWTMFAFQTTIMTTWSCNIVLYDYVYTIGGMVSLIWGTIVVAIGQTFLMMSLSEYAGIWPHAGGQQFFTQMLAPASMRRFLSYVVGWCVLIAEVSTTSSCALNSAEILAAFIEVTHPEIAWKPWMTFLIYHVFLIGPVVTNMTPGILPAISVLGGVFNVAGMIAWAAVFLAMAPRNSADFVFTTFINESGWSSKGWVFTLSLYVPMYGMYGTDSTLHMVEEMVNPARDAPRVMIWSMVFSAVVAWISAVIMGFTSGNWAAEMETTLPYLSWFMNTTRSVLGGGIFCAVMMMGLNYIIIVHTNTAASRLAWRMANDHGFPFPTYFSHVSNRFQTPMRAMFAVLLLNSVAGLLILGSDLAFWALISGGGMTLQIAYIVPIICVLCRGRKILPKRPYFDLGRFGYFVNYVSVAWSILVVIFFGFPQYVPVAGAIENMNWAIAIFGGCVIFCAIYWMVAGRKRYLIALRPSLQQRRGQQSNG